MRAPLVCLYTSLAMLLCFSGTANAGNIFDLVTNSYCSQITEAQSKAACLSYWGYRITGGQGRNEAFMNCTGNCENTLAENSVQRGRCKNACQNMTGIDN